MRIYQIGLNEAYTIVEFRENKDDLFAFKHKAGEKKIVGVCEFCSRKNFLDAVCKCKNVKYCNEVCMQRDKRFHEPKCSALADGELQVDN